MLTLLLGLFTESGQLLKSPIPLPNNRILQQWTELELVLAKKNRKKSAIKQFLVNLTYLL